MSSMARKVSKSDVLKDWIYKKFPHKWLTLVEGKSNEQPLEKMVRTYLFFCWLQICPLGGPAFTGRALPVDHETLEEIRRGTGAEF